MKSLWSDADAAALVKAYAARGVGEALALRTYSARLLGRDPALVMHGGGNTSVKTVAQDVFGDEVEVLCVKGSGWDLATIEPEGHPAVRLAPLRRLRTLDALSDEAMVNAQRHNLMESAAPNPSVETLLHAFLPHTFVDHTHSIAVCAVADQPDAEAVCRAVWGGRVACVSYVMPGFALAKAAAAIYEANPEVEGLILLKHGIFSFGATARESYERMIDLVSAAEDFIATRAPALGAIAVPSRRASSGGAETESSGALALCRLRGALGRAADAAGAPKKWVLDVRATPEILRLLQDPRLAELALRGVSTPDHVIRTKGAPVVLPEPPSSEAGLVEWRGEVDARLKAYADAYRSYFERNDARVGGFRRMLDPLPRLAAIPGLGLVGIGASAPAAAVAGDIGEAWAATLLRAEAVGRYEPVCEADQFDMEYWSLEQAKLGKAKEPRLARHVVVVTGAAGAIGSAVARAFAAEGAEVALLDLDAGSVEAAAGRIGPSTLALACDVTDRAAVDQAFDRIAARFGGVDIVVSNAGSAVTGGIAALPDASLRASFELNFFGHQNVAQAAVRLMRGQGIGGVLLFNVSKQALNPGPDFGAYGTAKAALLALMRQYALEHGADGIRANAINPDRIRSGLLTGAMISERATARGVSEATYMAGNLLGQEVSAEDVAHAFVAAALLEKTSGAIIPVDGGNVAAMPR